MIDYSITTVRYAGFWRRYLAFMLDMMLVIAILSPILYLIYGHEYFFWAFRHFRLFAIYDVWEALLTRVAVIVGIIAFWSSTGATPGKRLLDIRVVDVRSGVAPNWRQSALRAAAYVVSFLPFYLGFIWIAFDRKKRAWHDMIAKTIVIYNPEDYAACIVEPGKFS